MTIIERDKQAWNAWNNATPEAQESLRKKTEERMALHAAHPLVFRENGTRVRLWHRDKPRTSQRTALQNMGKLVTVVTGGHRAGKTQLGAQLSVAVAKGRDDPDVQIWAQVNKLDIGWIQRGAGRVWASSLSSGDSLEYVRPALDQYLPAKSVWRNRYRQGLAWVTLPGGGTIVCKMGEQGRKGYQGGAIHGAWFDEEHDEDVVNEALRGLVDHHGRMWLTMTPLLGLTYVYFRWVDGHDPDARVHWIHGEDNPHIDPEMLQTVLRQYGEHERAAREKGDFVTLTGGIYDIHLHLHVRDFEIDKDWPRFRGADFGVRNPSAVVWCAVDPTDATAYIYAEHYEREWTLRQHAEAIDEIDKMWGGEIYDSWGDPKGTVERRELSREHNILIRKADNAVRPGISKVMELLRPDVAGKPHLIFHPRCVNTIREHAHYAWSDSDTEADRPEKKHDHTCDAVRYLCMGLARGGWV